MTSPSPLPIVVQTGKSLADWISLGIQAGAALSAAVAAIAAWRAAAANRGVMIRAAADLQLTRLQRVRERLEELAEGKDRRFNLKVDLVRLRGGSLDLPKTTGVAAGEFPPDADALEAAQKEVDEAIRMALR